MAGYGLTRYRPPTEGIDRVPLVRDPRICGGSPTSEASRSVRSVLIHLNRVVHLGHPSSVMTRSLSNPDGMLEGGARYPRYPVGGYDRWYLRALDGARVLAVHAAQLRQPILGRAAL